MRFLYALFCSTISAHLHRVNHMGEDKSRPLAKLVLFSSHYGNHSNTLKRYSDLVARDNFVVVFIFFSYGQILQISRILLIFMFLANMLLVRENLMKNISF